VSEKAGSGAGGEGTAFRRQEGEEKKRGFVPRTSRHRIPDMPANLPERKEGRGEGDEEFPGEGRRVNRAGRERRFLSSEQKSGKRGGRQLRGRKERR